MLGAKPANSTFTGLCFLWQDQVSWEGTRLWWLRECYHSDFKCPSHCSGELSPDQSSLHPGMFLCFGHREAPNTLKKYTYGSTIAATRQQDPGKHLLISTSHILTHTQLVPLCCFRSFLLGFVATVKPGCIPFWILLSSWLVSSWCCRKRTENGWCWGKASII